MFEEIVGNIKFESVQAGDVDAFVDKANASPEPILWQEAVALVKHLPPKPKRHVEPWVRSVCAVRDDFENCIVRYSDPDLCEGYLFLYAKQADPLPLHLQSKHPDPKLRCCSNSPESGPV